MLHQLFETVTGIDAFGLISMGMFIVFFTFLVIHTFSLKKAEVDNFSRIPLDESLSESEKNVSN